MFTLHRTGNTGNLAASEYEYKGVVFGDDTPWSVSSSWTLIVVVLSCLRTIWAVLKVPSCINKVYY